MEREELLKLSQEELVDKLLKVEDIKKEAIQKRDNVKTESKELENKLLELEKSHKELLDTITKDKEAKSKDILEERISKLNIQDKFKQDLLNKAEVSVDMEDKDFNIAISKVLEEYPEYKNKPVGAQPEPTEQKDEVLEKMRKAS